MSAPLQPHPIGPHSRGSSCLPITIVAIAILAVLFMLALVASYLVLPVLPDFLHHGGQRAGVGQRLPRLRLYPLTAPGKVLTLADLQGQIVLLDFWGTWCPPCREELPQIAALAEKFRGDNSFRLLAVSCGQGIQERPAQLRAETQTFLDRENLELPTYADLDAITRNALDDVARFDGYPTTLVLDRQGIIRGIWAGYRPGSEREMEELIDQLLAER